MYGLPKDFNPAVFIDKTLAMVSFNLNQIILHFNDKIKITIEGSLTYRAEAGKTYTLTTPVSSTNLMALIEHKVVGTTALPNGTLVLDFDNGHKIECLETSANYESYQIDVSGKIIIVSTKTPLPHHTRPCNIRFPPPVA